MPSACGAGSAQGRCSGNDRVPGIRVTVTVAFIAIIRNFYAPVCKDFFPSHFLPGD